MTKAILENLKMVADSPLTEKQVAAIIEGFAEQTGFSEHANLKLYRHPSESILSIPRSTDWSAKIVDHWTQLRKLVCDDFHLDPVPRLEIELGTGLVTVDLPLFGEEEAAARSKLAKSLKLTPIAYDPDRYRNTATTHKAIGWSTSKFATALKEAINNVTGEAQPVLRHAYYTYEYEDEDKDEKRKNVERLRGFFDVDEMIQSLIKFAEIDGNGAKLREIRVAIQGPWKATQDGPIGRALGVQVDASQTPVRITFLSSLTPKKLAEVIAPIHEKLELSSPIPAHIAGSSTSTAEVKIEERPWAKHLLFPLIGAGIALLVSTEVVKAILSDHELVMEIPTGEGTEYPMSKPGPLEL